MKLAKILAPLAVTSMLLVGCDSNPEGPRGPSGPETEGDATPGKAITGKRAPKADEGKASMKLVP